MIIKNIALFFTIFSLLGCDNDSTVSENLNVPKRKIKYSVKSSQLKNKGGLQILFITNDDVLTAKTLENNWTYEFEGDSGKCFFITNITLLDENGNYSVSEMNKKITITKEMYIDDSLISKVNIRNNEFFVVVDNNNDCKEK